MGQTTDMIWETEQLMAIAGFNLRIRSARTKPKLALKRRGRAVRK